MKLDLSVPTFIAAGSFNSAIFQPPWLALHLFEKPNGTDVNLVQAITGNFGAPLRNYIDNVGVSATSNRFEVIPNDLTEPTKSAAEKVFANLFSKLPHTPVSAVGINFQFTLEDPSTSILDSLRCRDGFDELYPGLKEEKLQSAAAHSPGVDLNFSRGLREGIASFSFNYHHAPFTPSMVNTLHGSIDRLLEASLKTLESLYGLRGYEISSMNFSNPTDVTQND